MCTFDSTGVLMMSRSCFSTFITRCFVFPLAASANEGYVVSLSCSGGYTIGSIDFASYGTPGWNYCGGGLVQGWCHSGSSWQITYDNCFGRSSCSLSGTNGVFGVSDSDTFSPWRHFAATFHVLTNLIWMYAMHLAAILSRCCKRTMLKPAFLLYRVQDPCVGECNSVLQLRVLLLVGARLALFM